MNKILLVFTLVIVLSMQITPQGFLRTDGTKIVNGNGEEVILQGFGLGGWLVPEGYMLQTSGFANAPWEIYEKIESIIGEANFETFIDAYRKNYVNSKDIKAIAEWGANSIRLPMHYNLLMELNSDTFNEDGFAMIDSLLQWCKENDLYLILDMHCAPGGQSDENISDYNPAYPSLWESEANKTKLVTIWREIATRYANEEWIGGYDLINEPKWELGPQNQPLRDLYIRITNAIREVDTNHIVYIEGNWYATAFDGLTPPWDDNMVYSFHKYWNETDVGTINYLLSIRSNHDTPLWLGETGENSNAWFSECVDLMNAHKIGWAWWPHKKISSIAVPFSAYIPYGYQQLLDYWNGEGTKPSQEYAFSSLMEITEALKIENCLYRKDVIDALFRVPYDKQNAIPFKEIKIPGFIYAGDYDMGAHGVGYRDAEYKNTGGNSYNNGYVYRNDGVDLEKTTDFYTNGYNVGWIESGEYLNYTVSVEQAGTYNIHIRISGDQSGGKISLTLDGNFIANFIDVPNTGGWQNFETITVENIEIPFGKHQVGIRFFFGGFNYGSMDFELIAADVSDEDYNPEVFSVSENYPNPFNSTTNIRVYAPTKETITLKVLSPLGEEIATLAQNEEVYGEKIFRWNGKDRNGFSLSSGIYFYQIITSSFSEMRKMLLLK